MTADHVPRPWALRSTLIAVADLDRSVAFYREVGPFEEIAREDAVAVLGEESPSSIILILREPGASSDSPWPAVAGSPVDHLQRRIAR